MLESAVVQVAVFVSTRVLPSLYVPVATRGSVVPMANDALAGVTAIETSTASPTLSVAEPLIEPDVAVMIALPTPCPLANPNVGSILPIFYDNSTKYNGLQTQLLVNDLHGLRSQVSYTWSKCLDAGSGAGIADPFVNSISTLIFFNKAGRNGPCDFDIRHNLSVNYMYSFPSPKGQSTSSRLRYR